MTAGPGNDWQQEISCCRERYETTVPVEDFYRDCVDVERFLELCRACPNYGRTWSCPEYDFDVREYWKNYQYLRIIGIKVLVPEELQEKTWSKEEIQTLIGKILLPVKKQLTEELYELERQVPGSVHLSGGKCMLCPEGTCERLHGRPCRFPEKLRYSIESLGGNATKAAEYLGQTLEWAGPDKLPGHFILVGGLLY